MDCGCRNKTDRYVSFSGIDCDGNAERVLAMVLALIARPEVDNAFWQNFARQVTAMRSGSGPNRDALYLLHANVYYVRDLFDEHGDDEARQALDQLEEECF